MGDDPSEALDHSRMTWMWEESSMYPVLVLYPHKKALDYFNKEKVKKFTALLSDDRRWCLLREWRKGDGVRSIKIRPNKEERKQRPHLHVPIRIEHLLTRNGEKMLLDCEARHCEAERGWEFQVVHTIRFPSRLKSVS
jgi:hypothetical protein